MAHIKIALSNLGKYNEGEIDWVWLDLPATEEEFDKAYDEIEVCHGDKMYYDETGSPYEEMFISDIDTDLDIDIGMYYSVDNLNAIAEYIDSLSETDYEILQACCEANYIGVDDIINFDAEDYRWVPGATDNKELAYEDIEQDGGIEHLSEDTLIDYFDYEEYGRYLSMSEDMLALLGVDEDDPEEVEQVCAEYGVDDIEDIDVYMYYGANSDEELGKIYADEIGWEGVGRKNLEMYFDYERYGEHLAEDGDFVDGGFIEVRY